MKLTSTDGNELELTIVGYQFPEATDPDQRFSWHQVRGFVQVNGISRGFSWRP